MSIADSNKKRGRPVTGIGKAIGLRLYPDLDAAIDKWIKRHPEPKPSRPEAIRLILSEYLSAAGCMPTRRDLRPSKRNTST